MVPDARITKVLLTWPGLTSWQSKSSPNIWSLHPKTFFRQKRHNEESLSWLRKKILPGHSFAMGECSNTQEDASGRGDL